MINKKSLLALLVCYLIWGMQPVYWALLSSFDSMFIMCCRVFMSVFFTWLFLFCTGRRRELLKTFGDRKTMRYLIPAAALLACDWAFFIWAVTNGHVLDTALGYYMNPLIIFLTGVFLFKERGHLLEYAAVGVACLGILLYTLQSGRFPLLSVLFMVFWPAYATIKKAVSADPIVSVAVESALMLPFALASVLIWYRGEGGLASVTWSNAFLLVGSGVVTALPMILYTYVVNDMPFKVVGILQYAGTTITFLCGVIFMDEQVTSEKLIMFVCIWIGLALFTAGSFKRHKETLNDRHEAV